MSTGVYFSHWFLSFLFPTPFRVRNGVLRQLLANAILDLATVSHCFYALATLFFSLSSLIILVVDKYLQQFP